jgi:hypothetical protein
VLAIPVHLHAELSTLAAAISKQRLFWPLLVSGCRRAVLPGVAVVDLPAVHSRAPRPGARAAAALSRSSGPHRAGCVGNPGRAILRGTGSLQLYFRAAGCLCRRSGCGVVPGQASRK